MIFGQSLETSNSIRYVGQSVILSFYARKGADYSATSSALSANIYTGTGTDQSRVAASYTGDAQALTTSVTLTTTWQRFTVSGTIGATATELAVIFISSMTGTANTNDYYEVTGVQLELGTTASTFQTATGTIQGELAACQRYYRRLDGNSNSTATMATGVAFTTTVAMFVFPFGVQMRVAPTSLETSNQGTYRPANATAYNGGTWSLNQTMPDSGRVIYTHGSAVYTAGESLITSSTTTSSYFAFNAEL